ncbi:cuticle protein 8 [Fopius arisanus]|uniref:Cuticle protein 8 n=2 Tax=Fopius arisanus TaxID=64838 RepID=A0A9R1U6P5_9HYME|nr:PREDICTED: cuticle protein 8-like [Fopius arisanus]
MRASVRASPGTLASLSTNTIVANSKIIKMGALRMMILAMTITLTIAQQGYEDFPQEYDANPRQGQPTPRSYASGSPAEQRPQAPASPKPTPVAILKQINRHNEDGSYTYGFEGADGSFKIETKLANGEVKGKYGFVDDGGKVRIVQYGADQYGFQPEGEGITVAPPTLVDETTNREGLQGQNLDYQDYPRPAPQQAPARPQYRPAAQPVPAPPAPPQYRAPAQPAPTQYHTEALYGSGPKGPVFSPAGQQSPLLRAHDNYEQAPASQAYNQGPVQFGPAPVREANAPQTRNAQRSAAPGGGILDQLARDYALPQDAAQPLHDISFGYY